MANTKYDNILNGIQTINLRQMRNQKEILGV